MMTEFDLRKNDSLSKSWNAALRILARRSHSSGELKDKLYDREHNSSDIKLVIAKLLELNLLNDEDYAENYCRELVMRGYGPLRIKSYLYRKRISKRLVDQQLNGITEAEQLDAIKKLINNKLKALRREKDPYKLKRKLYNHLANKGHHFNLIKQACAESIEPQ